MHVAWVDYGQGWFWSKALPAEALEQALTAGFPNTGSPAFVT